MPSQPAAQPDAPPDTNLVSFVIRFVGQARAGGAPAAGWHGLIRHVQSDAERYFTRWEDAVTFIGQFVDVAGGESAPADAAD